MWTLRDKKYCKNDFWAEVLQNISVKVLPTEQITPQILNKVGDDYVKKKTYSFDINQDPIKGSSSSFWRFGIYKMENVIKNKRSYEGTQIIDLRFSDTIIKTKFQKCEHVNFNLGFIDQNCELYILPYF